MRIKDEPCIQSINRLYCYLRHLGVPPETACAQVQRLMPAIAEANGDINPAHIIHEDFASADSIDLDRPRPAATPALSRGHIHYAAP